jgi:septum formation protein
VLTGVALVGGEERYSLSESQVSFRTITPGEAAAYWETGEPMDKAGGYDIDQQGDLIIASYDGSYTNIMGLPAELISDWLERTG